MTDNVLLFETLGPVARLSLNRPKAMNSMNIAMLTELDGRLIEIATNEALRVVIVTGAGPAFCAGADPEGVLAGQKAGPGEVRFWIARISSSVAFATFQNR